METRGGEAAAAQGQPSGAAGEKVIWWRTSKPGRKPKPKDPDAPKPKKKHRGRKKYKRGERSGTSGTKHKKVLSEEELAARAAIKAEEKRLREKHQGFRCKFHKIMSAKTPHGDEHNNNVFEDRVALMRELCCQNTNVASAAVRTVPEEAIQFGDRTCEVLMVLSAKRSLNDIKKDFARMKSIRLATWEPEDSKIVFRELGPAWRVVRDATPASKQDAKLLMAALTGEDPGGKQRRKRGAGKSIEEQLAEEPVVKRQRLTTGRIATALEARPSMLNPSRSGKR